MQLSRTVAAAVLAAGIACSGAASAAADPSHYLLTYTVIEKFKAFEKDTRKDAHNDEALDPRDADDLIRKLDKDPAAKAALAKHGLSTREFALATFAMLHAGFFVAMEGAMDKKKAAEAFAGYTQEQRANIEMVREMHK
ncbi:hypothetical protein IP92_05045 [Pseudoduganella flava]|uniref:Uncharacterized protein n=1 Tax=Pseudoduganella flava TaxID=871742 RepID=A0A562PGB7_9BURK|nr:hypothetical protein [Pseudoduganella flava]QGZ40295.1 hypothetical protein GO485_15370 [Pseudoduganella flava]TWI43481.1 hypothetical protein IP92_05045 [Pseudoduganella flava]